MADGQHPVVDYDASQVLYRLAFASGVRAGRRLEQSVAAGGDIERLQRSRDALIEAVVLLQAAFEAWINRAYEQAGLVVSGSSWVGRWGGISKIAEALGRDERSLQSETRSVLNDVSVVRNFFVHGDRDADQRMAGWLGDRDLWDAVTVQFVGELFQRAEKVWQEARAITGLQTPFTDGAWLASDEIV